MLDSDMYAGGRIDPADQFNEDMSRFAPKPKALPASNVIGPTAVGNPYSSLNRMNKTGGFAREAATPRTRPAYAPTMMLGTPRTTMMLSDGTVQRGAQETVEPAYNKMYDPNSYIDGTPDMLKALHPRFHAEALAQGTPDYSPSAIGISPVKITNAGIQAPQAPPKQTARSRYQQSYAQQQAKPTRPTPPASRSFQPVVRPVAPYVQPTVTPTMGNMPSMNIGTDNMMQIGQSPYMPSSMPGLAQPNYSAFNDAFSKLYGGM